MKLALFRWTVLVANNKTKIAKVVGSVTAAFLLGIGLAYFTTSPESGADTVVSTNTNEQLAEQIQPVEIPKVPSPLSGLPVLEEEANLPVNAVIVENSPDARPQSGLHKAPVVFETVAEAGITRFLALFQTEEVEKIGPVRSIRPYFVEWAYGFDASLGHVGGSPAANDLSYSLGVKDINQGWYASSYYRSSDRYAPHNVYTTTDDLRELNRSLGYNSSTFEPWTRQTPEQSTSTNDATNITVDFSSSLYNTSYTYDPSSNQYARSLAGAPHTDQLSGEQITPDAVVVLVTGHSVVDSKGRMNITTTGSGSGHIFQNGVQEAITWKKPTQGDVLSFVDSTGQPVEVNEGQVWVAVISTVSNVNWSGVGVSE